MSYTLYAIRELQRAKTVGQLVYKKILLQRAFGASLQPSYARSLYNQSTRSQLGTTRPREKQYKLSISIKAYKRISLYKAQTFFFHFKRLVQCNIYESLCTFSFMVNCHRGTEVIRITCDTDLLSFHLKHKESKVISFVELF